MIDSPFANCLLSWLQGNIAMPVSVSPAFLNMFKYSCKTPYGIILYFDNVNGTLQVPIGQSEVISIYNSSCFKKTLEHIEQLENMTKAVFDCNVSLMKEN